MAISLESIGLTTGESKVYIQLLKEGQTSAGPLVKSGISRSKIYEILERLQQKGLVSSIIENGVKKFKAIDPKLIPDYLKKKKAELEQQEQALQTIIPQLIEESKEKAAPQNVEVYSGWTGVKNVFNLLIKDAKKGEMWLAFGIPEVMNRERTRFFKHWREETDSIGITQKLIANVRIQNSPELAPRSKLSQIRYLPYETATSVDIFREHVLLGVWTGNPILIMLTGDAIASSFRTFFNQIWTQATLENPTRRRKTALYKSRAAMRIKEGAEKK